MNEQRNATGGRVIGLSLGSSGPHGQQTATAPTIGWLTDAMVLRTGLPVPAGLADARVVPGVVFLLGRQLTGPGANAATALAAVDTVYAGVEIFDGRTPDLHSTPATAAAGSASTARLVTGPVGRRPENLDLSLEACLLEVDGAVFDSATGVAAYGHPAEALALAANALAEQDIALQPGWLVFTGGLTGAVSVTPGTTVAASFTHLGTITLEGH
ncbi:fumarylacetoacetate hydrolase family protein [Streptomyces sp. BBFR51]|uniref:fumarylacetoacetate hydrolase family protein n=1 Tax=Streptomyces sp. BBFR51 TaxID=3372856 RepID=UPI0037DCB047